METRVRVIFSCYEQSMQIIIGDNGTVSNNSSLKKYMNEPFEIWFDVILDLLHDEIGSRYYLEYCGRAEEARVLQEIAVKNSYCLGFSYEPFILNSPLTVRMKHLSEMLKEKAFKMPKKHIIKAEFLCSKIFLSKWEYYLKQLEIMNYYCFVRKNIGILDENNIFVDSDITVIMLAKEEALPIYLERIRSKQNIIVLIESSNDRISFANGKIVYEFTEDKFFNTIFEAFLLIPLIKVFNNVCSYCYEKIPNKSDKLRIAILQAIRPIINVRADTRIERGCVGSIKFWTDPSGYHVPELDFKYQFPDIVHITSEGVKAINAGTTIVKVYERGGIKPISTLEFTVYERNRISAINLSHTYLVLGIGDKYRLEYDYFPKDADNIDSITWSSDDTSVAYVENGIITVCGMGKCIITCKADDICEECKLEALPYLREISLPENLINKPLILAVGETYNLDVKLVPDNAYDRYLTYYSSNYLAVNVNQGVIKAISKGKAIITIENITKRLSTVLEVIVKDKTKEEPNTALSRYYNFFRRKE